MLEEFKGNYDAKELAFGIVVSRLNETVTKKLLEEAIDCLKRHGTDESNLKVFWVPDSFAIPYTVNKLAESCRFDALICLDTIIKGSDSYNDLISEQMISKISQINIVSVTPISLGILTTDTAEQAFEKACVKLGNKGFEAAMAAIEMATLNNNYLAEFAADEDFLENYFLNESDEFEEMEEDEEEETPEYFDRSSQKNQGKPDFKKR